MSTHNLYFEATIRKLINQCFEHKYSNTLKFSIFTAEKINLYIAWASFCNGTETFYNLINLIIMCLTKVWFSI